MQPEQTPNTPEPNNLVNNSTPTSPSPQPQPSQPAAPTPISSETEPFTGKPQKSSKGLIAGLIALFVIIISAGCYVFFIYLPNTPDNVYKAGLANSAKAVDNLTNYFAQQSTNKDSFKNSKVNAKVSIKSPTVSADSSLQGAFDRQGNGSGKVDVNVMGQKFSIDVRSIVEGTNASPDIYVKASNIKPVLNKYGLSPYVLFDGQWIKVDHTIIDSAIAKEQAKTAKDNAATAVKRGNTPSTNQIYDAISKINSVNEKYLFSTDPQTAILKNDEFVGQETKNGRSVNHYKVSYNKDNLQTYIKALGPALDSSQLNDWYKKSNDGKDISEPLDLNSVIDSIKNENEKYGLDMWIDAKTKLIQSIQLTDKKDDSGATIVLSQGYTGGSVYPFGVEFSGKQDSGQKLNIKLGLTVDTETNKYSLSGSGDMGKGQSFNTDISITESQEDIKPSVPAGAKSINEIISQLNSGLGGGSNNKSLLF